MEKQIIHEKQDLTYLNWAKVRDSSGTAGSFLKAYSDLGKEKIYYKLSNYDAFRGIIGHECVNEIIADRLLTILGIEHLHYQLIHADILVDGAPITTWLCSSGDYKEYDEFALLMLAHGRCAQDSYHLVEIAEKDLPPEMAERWLKKIEDVVPLAERQLLVFFRDGLVKKCDMRALMKAKPAFAPILNSDKLFRSVGVQMGGYGICWGEQLTISDDDLYRHGVDVPLSMDDFRSFIADRVVNSAEAQQMLGCTRQNINDLIRRGKLHPIREDAKNKLFLKNEIQQRIQK